MSAVIAAVVAVVVVMLIPLIICHGIGKEEQALRDNYAWAIRMLENGEAINWCGYTVQKEGDAFAWYSGNVLFRISSICGKPFRSMITLSKRIEPNRNSVDRDSAKDVTVTDYIRTKEGT